MITASHNPPEYNGVKIIEPDGTEMGDEDTIRLEGLLSDQPLLIKPWDQVGTEVAAPHLIDEYIHSVTCQFAGKPGEGMTVVVDPGSGAACQTTGNSAGTGVQSDHHQRNYGWNVSGPVAGTFCGRPERIGRTGCGMQCSIWRCP